MARGPMTALLAVLALAGYQNRDKIGEVLNNLRNGEGLGGGTPGTPGGQTAGGMASGTGASGGGLGGLLGGLGGGGLGDLLGGSSSGGILSGGLGGILDQFRANGLGHKAETWVGKGENAEIQDHELGQALGEDTLSELEQKTGLSRSDILTRLSRELPRAVDDLTPEGRLPDDEAGNVTGSAGGRPGFSPTI